MAAKFTVLAGFQGGNYDVIIGLHILDSCNPLDNGRVSIVSCVGVEFTGMATMREPCKYQVKLYCFICILLCHNPPLMYRKLFGVLSTIQLKMKISIEVRI